MDLKIGDVVIITNFETNSDERSPHYNGEISVIDRIDYPFYYLENDNTTPFTKEQLSVISVIDRIDYPFYYLKTPFTREQLSVISTKNKFNMIKCKKCNSNNVKVDFDKVLTSIPSQYNYCCQDCGGHGYVNCNEVNYSDFTPEGYQKYQRPQLNLDNLDNIVETPKEENKGGGLMGWICPKCGRCYSPFTSMCPHCNNSDWSDWSKVTCLG